MRNVFLGIVSALAFPAVASAALQLNVESLNVVSDADQTRFIEVFFTESAPVTAEELGTIGLALNLTGANVGPSGVRFGGVELVTPTTDRPFVFREFAGTTLTNQGSTPTLLNFVINAPLDPANSTRSLTTDPDNMEGVLRIPVVIPAGTVGTFGLSFNPSFTVLNNADGTEEIPFVATTGTITAAPIPEPASLGLLAVGGLLALRRRRMA